MANVLIVDDEKSIRVTLGEFLRREGYEVAVTGDADTALSLFKKTEFDVVLSDIILPGKNGVTLLRKIKDISPQTQVIMMTGEPTAETASQSLRRGASEYVFKPCTKAAVLRVVGHASKIKALSDEKEKLEIANRQYRENLEKLVAERTTSLREREKRLENILQGSLHALGSTVAIRDPYTAGHERRVAYLAKHIAKWLGFSAADVRGIEVAGFLHDIGKIAVPAEILSKPGKLTHFEFGIIKSHPQVGYEVLRQIDFDWPVADTTLQHHERLNGSGYPAGLKGDKIIVEARILAVADVVEAMASHRPYRPALGMTAALDEIEAQRGVLYDPDAVAACSHVVKDEQFVLEWNAAGLG